MIVTIDIHMFQEHQENQYPEYWITPQLRVWSIAAIARDWNQKSRPQGPILINSNISSTLEADLASHSLTWTLTAGKCSLFKKQVASFFPFANKCLHFRRTHDNMLMIYKHSKRLVRTLCVLQLQMACLNHSSQNYKIQFARFTTLAGPLVYDRMGRESFETKLSH